MERYAPGCERSWLSTSRTPRTPFASRVARSACIVVVTYVVEPTYPASLPGCANAVADSVAAANNRVSLFIDTSIRLNFGF